MNQLKFEMNGAMEGVQKNISDSFKQQQLYIKSKIKNKMTYGQKQLDMLD